MPSLLAEEYSWLYIRRATWTEARRLPVANSRVSTLLQRFHLAIPIPSCAYHSFYERGSPYSKPFEYRPLTTSVLRPKPALEYYLGITRRTTVCNKSDIQIERSVECAGRSCWVASHRIFIHIYLKRWHTNVGWIRWERSCTSNGVIHTAGVTAKTYNHGGVPITMDGRWRALQGLFLQTAFDYFRSSGRRSKNTRCKRPLLGIPPSFYIHLNISSRYHSWCRFHLTIFLAVKHR